MFSSPLFRSGTVISDQGFQVTLKTRYQLEYKDSDNLTVNLNYDAVFPNCDLLVLSWQAWCADRLLDMQPAERSAIMEKISAALMWKGYEVHMVQSS